MKPVIIGLVGSGKTTLYRWLNLHEGFNSVELELPPACRDDEETKKEVFNAFIASENIDVIISHPFFLPKDFKKNASVVYLLDVSREERERRIELRNEREYFDDAFLEKEEAALKEMGYLEKWTLHSLQEEKISRSTNGDKK